MSREEQAVRRLARITEFLAQQKKCPEPFRMTVAEQAGHVRHLAEQAYQIVTAGQPEELPEGEPHGL